jgi:hypothetical protein
MSGRYHDYLWRQSWHAIEAVIEAGGTPDKDDIDALLRKGVPVPPRVAQYLATKKQRGRPKQANFLIEHDQWHKAEAFTKEIRALKRKGWGCTLAEACAKYGKAHNGISAGSVEREYWRALATTRRHRAEWAAHTKEAASLLGETPRRMIRRMLRSIADIESGKKQIIEIDLDAIDPTPDK